MEKTFQERDRVPEKLESWINENTVAWYTDEEVMGPGYRINLGPAPTEVVDYIKGIVERYWDSCKLIRLVADLEEAGEVLHIHVSNGNVSAAFEIAVKGLVEFWNYNRDALYDEFAKAMRRDLRLFAPE